MGTTSCALFAVTSLLVLTHFEFLQTEAFCSQYVESEGYSCIEHKLYTEDGYGLLLHRVGAIGEARKGPLPGSSSASTNDFPGLERSQSPTPPADVSVRTGYGKAFSEYPNQAIASRRGDPVLLLHPEMLNGDSWFKHADLENQTARLPFLLTDEGFDVWIGHHRATHWSHDHVLVSHQEPAYWKWTWDQLAQHDVPTMLQFLATETGGKVHVVGFSQGATVGAAAATRAKVAGHMKSLTLIGPTMYRGVRNPLLTGPWAGFLRDLLREITHQIAASPGWVNFTRDMRELSNFKPILSLTGPRAELRFPISGPDCCLSPSLSLLDNGWDGTTSSSNIEHFHQALVTPSWRKFDHGTAKLNFEAYGNSTPPDYEPKDIPADLPVLVIYGARDLYSPAAGVEEFITSMQSLPSIVALSNYAHLDLFFSTNRKQDVYDPISTFLRSNETA